MICLILIRIELWLKSKNSFGIVALTATLSQVGKN